ncbi:MAG TPA: PAS domain S-box protein [Patescibacteria group bacterium]|nr:PAS domain S-box protein [Patescibacteria group bacterium]
MDALKEIDFRLLLEQLPAILWATDRDLRFVYSRGAGLAALGLGADEVVGLPLSDHLGTHDLDDPTLAVHRAALAGVATVYELRHEGRVYQVHVEPWRAGSDGIVGVLGVALDITGRARAEAALVRSERTLAEFFENAEAEFFENAAMGLHWIGPDGIVLRANQAELDLLGYAREEYVGRPIAEFHVDPEVITEILARLGRGETVDAWEARMRARDGSIKHVLISSNVLWEDGRFVHTRCFTRDITDRRRMEEAHRQADLLHHVASLAHAAAHEINNPLAVIYGQLDLIARTGGPETKPRITACREAIARIAEILDRMNSLARLQLSQGWPADLPAMLDLKASSAEHGGTHR